MRRLLCIAMASSVLAGCTGAPSPPERWASPDGDAFRLRDLVLPAAAGTGGVAVPISWDEDATLGLVARVRWQVSQEDFAPLVLVYLDKAGPHWLVNNTEFDGAHLGRGDDAAYVSAGSQRVGTRDPLPTWRSAEVEASADGLATGVLLLLYANMPSPPVVTVSVPSVAHVGEVFTPQVVAAEAKDFRGAVAAGTPAVSGGTERELRLGRSGEFTFAMVRVDQTGAAYGSLSVLSPVASERVPLSTGDQPGSLAIARRFLATEGPVALTLEGAGDARVKVFVLAAFAGEPLAEQGFWKEEMPIGLN